MVHVLPHEGHGSLRTICLDEGKIQVINEVHKLARWWAIVLA